MWVRILIVFALLGLYVSAKAELHTPNDTRPPYTPAWNSATAFLTRASAGPLPGLGADIQILHVFGIQNHIRKAPSNKNMWQDALHRTLLKAWLLDPYFHDTYRLTEGLLAFDANRMTDAIALLARSEPYLHEEEPLFVAAFLAHKYLQNDSLAVSLAIRASHQTQTIGLSASFAARLIENKFGCSEAAAFLTLRMRTMRPEFRAGLKRRLKQLEEGKCKSVDLH